MNIPVDKSRFGKQIFPQAAGQIIVHRNLVSPFKEFLHHMAADVTGPAYD
jgi:hypothetical protein